jgi:GT2 family glycosyltransferase
VSPPPAISVVVPTRGRPPALARCLGALDRTTLDPEEIEVVVVGDGLDLAPPDAAATASVPVVWRTQPRAGPAAARNLGAGTARAPVLAFTDDDCVPPPQWAERMLAHVSERPSALVGGRVRNGLPQNPWSAASHLVLDVVIELHARSPGSGGFAPSSNLALRRETFEAVGGFDERFQTAAAEDKDFCDRCAAAGHPIVLAEGVTVDHVHDLDAGAFLRQAAAYGRGEVTYRAVSAERGGPARVRHSFYPLLARAARAYGLRRGAALVWRALANQAVFNASYWDARRRAA